MRVIFLPISLLIVTITLAQEPVGIFSNHIDIGKPKLAGNTVYNGADQSYSLKGAGYNIWFGRDEFQYAFNKIKGDFILTGNFKMLGNGGDPHRKIGWMVRAGEGDDAPHMTATVHGIIYYHTTRNHTTRAINEKPDVVSCLIIVQ